MEFKDISQKINKIKETSDDDEMAHGLEDELYKEFIKSIAEGKVEYIQEKAKMILIVQHINFSRWCA